jgi:hypothetical protein
MGGKLFQGRWGPDESQEGGAGGGGVGGGGGGGGQQGGEDKNHRHELWIAKEDHKPPQHQGKSKISSGGGGGAGGGQGQQQQKQLEEAVMVSTDEKNGYTARVGKKEDAVRIAAHEKGSKTRAGKSYYVAEKDGNTINYSEKEAVVVGKSAGYFQSTSGPIYAKGSPPCVNRPWVIRSKSPETKDPVPNDDKLGNKSGGGGGGGGGG